MIIAAVYRQAIASTGIRPQSAALLKPLQAERHTSTIRNNAYYADTMHSMIAFWRTGPVG